MNKYDMSMELKRMALLVKDGVHSDKSIITGLGLAAEHIKDLEVALHNLVSEIGNGPKHTGMTVIYLEDANKLLNEI